MDYAQNQGRSGKRLVAIAIVIVMHVLLGYALVTGLASKVIEVVKAPVETRIIKEVKPPPPPENLPPPPKFAPPPPPFVPPPEVIVPPQAPAPTITTAQTPTPAAPAHPAAPEPTAPPAPAPTPMATRPAIANVRACAPTADDYPRAAVRAEATGTTRIRFTIDGSGNVVKAEIVKSAGPTDEHRMLDRVAVDKLSTCRFTPGTDANGQPVGGSFEVNYMWKLQ